MGFNAKKLSGNQKISVVYATTMCLNYSPTRTLYDMVYDSIECSVKSNGC